MPLRCLVTRHQPHPFWPVHSPCTSTMAMTAAFIEPHVSTTRHGLPHTLRLEAPPPSRPRMCRIAHTTMHDLSKAIFAEARSRFAGPTSLHLRQWLGSSRITRKGGDPFLRSGLQKDGHRFRPSLRRDPENCPGPRSRRLLNRSADTSPVHHPASRRSLTLSASSSA